MKKSARTKIFVVINDTTEDTYVSLSKTKERAEQVTAKEILSRVDEIDDDEVYEKIVQAHKDHASADVISLWNDWSKDTLYMDEYVIRLEELDETI